jgi:ring-1,2-phenylacetyl-CoA epoxidase subunit PaaE
MTETAQVTLRRPQRRRPTFHPLTVAEVRQLTDDSVSIGFAVPVELREAYDFSPGQHLTVRRFEAAGEIRRSYSICSTPALLRDKGVIHIGVRRIEGGAFSDHATRGMHVGEVVEVLPPLGHFTTPLDPTRTRHYAAVAAGSGITPVLSLLISALETEPASRFTLIYGNRGSASVMFADDVADLKDRFPQRLHVIHAFSREPQLSALLSGRLDATRLRALLDSPLVDARTVDEWFLCGPYGLVVDAQGVLADRGVDSSTVHTELFHVEGQPVPVRRSTTPGPAATTVTMVLDGRESTFTMGPDERVLDAALKVRGELPYACRGGVCSTCRAKLVEGEVVMAQNYALEPDELAAGYVLTCQSVPVTERLVVDYDA